MKTEQVPSMPHTVTDCVPPQTSCVLQVPTPPAQATNTASGRSVFAATEESKKTPPGQMAVPLKSVAMAGLTDEELSDSGGEGMYRERDEFVVRNEDIENMKVLEEKLMLV